MLDVAEFLGDKGGDPKRIRESQHRRYAPEEAVDEVIALHEAARRGMFECTAQEVPSTDLMLVQQPMMPLK